MKVVIIEDEKLSAEHLCTLLQKIDPSTEVVAHIDSVKKSIAFFQQSIKVDLVFLDIHLSDGISFDIFSNIIVDTPIIFTTAYDNYVIKAFQLNSVDYLLKPIDQKDLIRALDKYKKMNVQLQTQLLHNISSVYQHLTKQYKTRFLVKSGTSIDSIKTEDVIYFTTIDSISFLVIENGKKYAIDYSLDQLMELLSPEHFFRINRKTIIHISSIQKVNSFFNGRLSITAPQLEGDNAIVSRERVNEFKAWLDK